MSGEEFENSIIESVKEWVGDDGAVMYQNQSFQMRGGQLQMEQKADILVDSPRERLYIGFEAKTRDGSNAPGMYFSKMDPEQFHRQLKYEEQSGRDLYVVFEIRNHRGADRAYVAPLTLFTRARDNELVKVTWEMIEEYGVPIGCDGDYEVNDSIFEAVDDKREEVDNASPEELAIG